MSKIRICHIAQSIGGVERYINYIVKYLDREAYSHLIICTEDGDYSSNSDAKNLDIQIIQMVREINFYKDIKSFYKIIKIVIKTKPNIIHAHSSKGGLFGRIIGYIFSIPVAYTPHAFYYLGKNNTSRKIFLYLERILCLFPAALIATSPSEARRALEEVHWNINTVYEKFPNSIEVSSNTKVHKKTKIITVLFIGRFTYQKNPELFIEIVEIVHATNPNILFKIIGSGYGDHYGQNINNLINRKSLNDCITVHAWTNYDKLVSEIEKCDIYISTSRYESFGYTTAEAMSMGIPVIATLIDGTKDLISHNKTGLLVESFNKLMFSEYINMLANNSKLRQRFGDAGKAVISQKFNIKKNISSLELIYNEILKNRQR